MNEPLPDPDTIRPFDVGELSLDSLPDRATLARWRATLDRVHAALERYHEHPMPAGSFPTGTLIDIRPLDADAVADIAEVEPDDR